LEREVSGSQLLDLTDVLEDAHGELAERTPDIGELDVAADPLEQREPERRFEATNHATDRSLGEAERLGGSGDVLPFRDGKKGVQLVERDPRTWMARTRRRRTHCGVSREAPVLGGVRWLRWPRSRARPIPRWSACRCRRSRPARPGPRTDPRRR